MATTQFGVNHPLAVKLWSKKLLHEALKATWASKFIGKDSGAIVQILSETSKEAGDKVTFGLRTLLSGNGVQGDATLEGNEEALSFYADSVMIDQLRHAVRTDGKMTEQRVPYNLREEARMGLTDWFADRLDTAFFNQLAGNTAQADTRFTGNNATIAPDNEHWVMATGVAGTDLETSLSASSVFSLSLIDTTVTKAKTLASNPLRPVRVGGENKYVMFIHPYQHLQLRQNTNTAQYMDIQKAAVMGGQISKNPIYTGALAEYNGVILHEAHRVPTGLNATSVRRAILCGAQAAVMAFGKDTSGAQSMSWREEMFDYGNQLGVAAGMISGMKKSRFNSKDFGTMVVSSYSPAP